MNDQRRPSTHDGYEEDTMKPDAPGHHSTEPVGSEGASDTTKTMTDPVTGAPSPGRPETAGG